MKSICRQLSAAPRFQQRNANSAGDLCPRLVHYASGG
jgi:hypothetical protein